MSGILKELYDSLKRLFGDNVEVRSIKEVDSWDGSASQFDTTADFCRACLINLNTGDEADWIQTNCKLPVRGPGDASTVYVKQALGPAAAALAGARTPMVKPDGVSQDEWDAAVKSAANKLISAYGQADEIAPASVYEKAGKEAPEEARAMSSWDVIDALWLKLQMGEAGDEEGNEREAYLMDVYYDGGDVFAIANSMGKLYRIPFTVNGTDVVLGEWQEVQHSFTPVETRTAYTVKRQQDGRYRWFSQSCTAVLNRVGEIDSTELFDAFSRNVEEYGYPYRTFYHSGKTLRTGQADFVARDGYVLITSGLYDDTPLAEIEIKALQNNQDYWGESIGYQPLNRTMLDVDGIAIPVYTDGYLEEISTLPEREAAALFTKSKTQEVKRMLTGKVLEAFMKLAADAGMDEAQAKTWLESNPDITNRQISDQQMIARSGDPQDTQAVPAESQAPAEPEAPVDVPDVQRVAQMLEAQQGVIRELVDQMTAFVTDVTGRLEALEEANTRQRQAYLDDLPELPAVNIWRPKQARAAEGDGEGDTTSAADQANAVLKEKMRKQKAAQAA